MSWDFFEALGALIATLGVGCTWDEMTEKRGTRRSSVAAQRHNIVQAPYPRPRRLQP